MRDTIDMAREAGIKHDLDGVWCEVFELKTFEALVRADAIADEREACAKVAEWEPCMTDTPKRIAAAIRARGNA